MNAHREVIDVEQTKFFMPYAPVIRVRPGPHEHDQLDPPPDVREQARLVGTTPRARWWR